MKNIHVLPTEKPSRLWMTKLGNLTRCHDIKPIKEALGNNVNIYITNDSEIKEGDWFTDSNNSLKTSYKLSHVQFANPKKIILTTDDLLIKDGVQAIDDEFLEWFVKNPSCERVEVIYEPKNFLDTKQGWEYEIIIPKEEPKQETLEEDSFIAGEEAFKEFRKVILEPNRFDFVCGFTEGAKWKEEQDKNKYSDEKEFYKYMAKQDSWKSVGLIIQEFIQLKLKEQDKKLYSEEDIKEAFRQGEDNVIIIDLVNLVKKKSIVEWFEKFKKK